MSTARERKYYIEQQRRDSAKYGVGPTKRVLGDMSFIDREGNIIRPTRDNPFPTASHYAGKNVESKKHYHLYKGDEQAKYHSHRDYSTSQGISAMLGIAAIFAGIFFLSSSMTGNVIGLSNNVSSWTGVILILTGLVASFFWVRNQSKK